MKNIPIGSKRGYKQYVVEKIEEVIKRMRWKVIMFTIENITKERIQKGMN